MAHNSSTHYLRAVTRKSGASLAEEGGPLLAQEQFLRNMMVAISAWTSHELSRVVKTGQARRVGSGQMVGRLPRGYQPAAAAAGGVRLDPAAAAAIRWAFETYAAGNQTLGGIGKKLLQRGVCVRSRTGRGPRALNASEVRTLLSNPFYCGIIRYDDRDYPGLHEPVITRREFRQVQRMLDRAKTSETRAA